MGKNSAVCECSKMEIPLTLDVELHGGVGHPNHVLCDAGQLIVVVISADVEQGQVDGMGGGVDIRLEQERREETHKRGYI